MMKRTRLARSQHTFQGFNLFTGSMSSAQLDMHVIFTRERHKRVRGFGSFHQYDTDRWWRYMHHGGVRKERYRIKPHVHRAQYTHFMQNWEKYDITVMENPAQYMYTLAHSMYTQTWDCSLCHNSAMFDGCLKSYGRRFDRNDAIKTLEEWGVRFSITPTDRSYGIDGYQYNKHNLYSHNFPWLKDPETWSSGKTGHGDADWEWKGEQKIDYANYGASTKSAKNDFKSLWLTTKEQFKELPPPEEEKGAATKKPAAKAAKAAKAARSTKA